MDFNFVEISLRLIAAALVGAIIGINRDLANKPIGSRTLGLVALGAAAVAISSTQVPGMIDNPDALSRVIQGVIQGVMAGISFIGAGVILRDAKARTVEGLTTAATVWVTAALGIACAFAAWRVIFVSLALVLVLLIAVGWVERLFSHSNSSSQQ